LETNRSHIRNGPPPTPTATGTHTNLNVRNIPKDGVHWSGWGFNMSFPNGGRAPMTVGFSVDGATAIKYIRIPACCEFLK